MLTWICAKTNKDDPSFEGMKGQFPKLEKAVNFSLNEANNNINKLKGISNQIKKGIENLDVSDTFKQKSSEQSESIIKKVDEMEKKHKNNCEVYEKTVKYYGYKDKDKFYTQNELFFKMLVEFFNEVNKAMPKLDVKKILTDSNRSVGKKVDQNMLMNNLMSQLKARVQGQKS